MEERSKLLREVVGLSETDVSDIEKVLEMKPSLKIEVTYKTEGEEGIQEGDVTTVQAWITLKRSNGLIGAIPHSPYFPVLSVAITGDTVLLKFEKSKIALIDGLKRVDDIIPSSIGSQNRNLVALKKGSTGFAEHDDHLEAKEYKHLGSGSGLGACEAG
ncbi:unnamed protein product [Arabis nemorensis]|uniref:Uncharacterized protein n=1 Tax=Arabis nemorensis TaxID=586526 RepID=A0A565AVN9_9BRAS|nr:unnamed protein product [Arabis nemorensis]